MPHHDSTTTPQMAASTSTLASAEDVDSQQKLRVVLAKLGYDGHDRGVKVVARILRDAGMEVIYLGLRQTYANVVNAVIQEDADVVGLSMHNASHMTLAPRMVEALREAELNVPVAVGGIIPDEDREELLKLGIAAVLGPGTSAEEVAASVRRAVAETTATDQDSQAPATAGHQESA